MALRKKTVCLVLGGKVKSKVRVHLKRYIQHPLYTFLRCTPGPSSHRVRVHISISSKLIRPASYLNACIILPSHKERKNDTQVCKPIAKRALHTILKLLASIFPMQGQIHPHRSLVPDVHSPSDVACR